MDGKGRREQEAGGVDQENPMEKILEQMQRDNFSHAPGEEMTHVAGVSFVDDVGLSLGAAPSEEAGRAGAYRHIANCANQLEALVLDEEDSQERDRFEQRLEQEQRASGRDGAQGGQDYGYSYSNSYNSSDGGGHHQDHHRGGRGAHSSTRLRGDDRHIVIQRNEHSNEVAAVVLKKRPDLDHDDDSDEAGEDSSS